jgi:hypothetical protein
MAGLNGTYDGFIQVKLSCASGKSNNSSGIVADNDTKEEAIRPSSHRSLALQILSSLPLFFPHGCLFWVNEALTSLKKPRSVLYKTDDRRILQITAITLLPVSCQKNSFDFTASQGNDLCVDGLSGNCK